jgi:hypothetical protein
MNHSVAGIAISMVRVSFSQKFHHSLRLFFNYRANSLQTFIIQQFSFFSLSVALFCDTYLVGLLTACGLGIMRTMYASHKAELNCVAVDIVAKTLIVVAWKSAMDNERRQSDTIHAVDVDDVAIVTNVKSEKVNENLNCRQLCVYNCASLHNMDLELLVYDGALMIRKFPFEKSVWVPGGGVTLCKVMNFYRVSLIHVDWIFNYSHLS